MKRLVPLMAFFLWACSPQNQNPKNNDPNIIEKATTSTLVEFGTFKQTDTQKLMSATIFNNTGSNLVGPATLSSSNFAFLSGYNCSAGAKNNASCTAIKLTFNPAGKSPGEYNATLNLGSISVPLHATISSPPPPVVSISSSLGYAIDFGAFLSTNNSSTIKTLTITNTGSASMIGVVSLSGTAFTKTFDSCNTYSIAKNATCQIKISFNPYNDPAGVVNEKITINGSDISLTASVSTPESISQSGQPVVIGGVSYTSDVNFYNGTSIISSYTYPNNVTLATFTIKNIGNMAAIISSPVLSDNINFSFSQNTCNNLSLAVNQSCQIKISLMAASLGSYSSNLTFANKTLSLSATKGSCNSGFHIEGNQCVADVITFAPIYSNYNTCSAQICDGTGIQSRSLSSCQKLLNGTPVLGGTLTDCESFNIPSNLQQACQSPAGNKTIAIDNGSKEVSCDAGSNVQNLVSLTCSNDFHEQSGACVANVITFEPSYSAFGACSAQVCDGTGTQSRTLSSCQKISNGTPVSGGQLSDCSAYNTAGYLDQPCLSPNGSKIVNIVNGQQEVYCAAGETTYTINNTTCDLNFELSGQSCISSCTSEQHRNLEGLCVNNSISCSVANGSGTQTWNGSSYEACTVTNCDLNYSLVNNTCEGNNLSLSLSKSQGGIVVSNLLSLYGNGAENNSINFNYSSNVEVFQAQASSGYHFVSWGGDCASAGSNEFCAISLTANQNITALFEPNLLTFYYGAVSGEGGTVSGSYSLDNGQNWTIFSSGFSQLPENALIKLEATPQPGKDFFKWYPVSDCLNNFTNTCQFNLPNNLLVVYAEFGNICDSYSHKESGACVYNYRQCSSEVLTSVSPYANSGTQHYENGVWGNYCTIGSCINGYNVNEFQNICEPTNVTYSPVFSAPSSCSASTPCSGMGITHRTLTGCKKYVSNVFQSNVDIGNCSIYDIPEMTDTACSSPAGNINVTIDNGYKTVSCSAGSTTQNFSSITCDNLYSAFGETCVSQKLLTVTQPTIVSNQIKVTVGSHVNESLNSVYINDSSIVQLTASPGPNFEFNTWVGDCSGQGNPCSLTMSSNKNVGAVFECISGYQLIGQNCVSTLSAAITGSNLPIEYVSLNTSNPITAYTSASNTFSTTGSTYSGTGTTASIAAITPSGTGNGATGTGSSTLMDASSANNISVNLDSSSVTSCSNPYISVTCTTSSISFDSSTLSLLNLGNFMVNLNNASNLQIPYKYYQIEQISNINPGLSDVGTTNNSWMVQRETNIYYKGVNSFGSKLFKYNPTLGSITQISNTNPSQDDGISNLTLFNGEIYFFAIDPSFNARLFKVDSQDRVIQVSNFNATTQDVLSTSNSGYMTVFNNELYFVGLNSSNFMKIFKINTSGVISQASNIRNGANDNPVNLTVFNGELYFIGQATNGVKLFKMTSTGITTQITNFRTASDISTSPSAPPLMVFQNALYFSAINTSGFQKLFKLSSTGSISQVSNIRGSTLSDSPIVQVVFNGELYFNASSASGVKLFKINDTGTITQVSTSTAPSNFAVVNNELYFYQSNGTFGKLHKLNNSGELIQVSNIKPGASDLITGVASIGTDLYFISNTTSGNKLFRLKQLK